MRLSDVTVEVRDAALERKGLILPTELVIELYPLFNEVGSWKLTLAAEHPMTEVLRTPGSGIIVTGPNDVLLSGPVTVPSFESTPEDPAGTVTFQGITDDHVLRDRLSYPKPSTDDVTAQDVGHDTRIGHAETLLHAYVNANVGPSAPSSRKVPALTLGANLDRGDIITKKPRFQNLLELLQEIAIGAGLRFRVVQRGDELVFETEAILDRSALIRLSAEQGTLSGQKVAVSPPGVTRVIVAGQGEQEDRTFIEVTDAAATAAEGDWSRRIEQFKDQRNTNVAAELTKAGEEILAENGFTTVVVQAIANDDTDGTMRYGYDWHMGDKVTVVVQDQELQSIVTGIAVKANAIDGFKLGIILGDPVGFSYNASIRKKLTSVEQRVSALETNETPAGPRPIDGTVLSQSTSQDSYPLGESVFYLSSAEALAGGWEFWGKYGYVVTRVYEGGDAHQRWMRVGEAGAIPEEWFRHGNAATGWGSWRRVNDSLSKRVQWTLTGGGLYNSDTAMNIGWSKRFVAMHGEKNLTTSTSGYYEIDVPPDGTVIPVLGSSSLTSTVAAGRIMAPAGSNGWWTLWYRLPRPHDYHSVPENFVITEYHQGGYEMPDDYVMVAACNPEDRTVRWGNGITTAGWWFPTLTNGWSNYSSIFQPAKYKKLGTTVTVEGLVKGGSIGATSATAVFQFPEGFRPSDDTLRPTVSNSLMGRFDILATGHLVVEIGSTAWVNIGTTFEAEQ